MAHFLSRHIANTSSNGSAGRTVGELGFCIGCVCLCVCILSGGLNSSESIANIVHMTKLGPCEYTMRCDVQMMSVPDQIWNTLFNSFSDVVC